MATLDLTDVKSYGDCEGPFGFPMDSVIAREAEKIWDKVDKDCKEIGYKRQTFLPDDMKIDVDERADVSVITSDAVDRDKEVMFPGGADFRQFMKNPVVPFAHDYGSLPVGRALWVKRKHPPHKPNKPKKSFDDIPNGWMAKTRYTPAPDNWKGTWFPDAVFHFIKEGDLRGKSIGFMPTEVRPPEEKEIENRPELAGVSRIISKYTILEYSPCPVQSNPDALTVSVGKAIKAGIEVPEQIYNAFGIWVPKSFNWTVSGGKEGDPQTISYSENETQHLFSSKENKKRILRSIDQIEEKQIPDPVNVLTEKEYRERIISAVNVDRAVKNALDFIRGGV